MIEIVNTLYKNIKKYRSQLMGLSILLVVSYHIVPKDIQYSFLLPFQLGCVGVDVFLLVSGFGLYCSLSKNSSIIEFYKKRFYRTWLPFIISTSIFSFIYAKSFNSFICEVTTYNYFIGKGFWLWYMPCIFILYFIYPFIFKSQNKIGFKILVPTYLFSFILTLIFLFSGLENLRFQYVLFTTRIPVFIIGSLLASSNTDVNITCNTSKVIISFLIFPIVSSVLTLFWFNTRNIYIFVLYLYSLGFLAIFLCFNISSLLFNKNIASILSIFGSMSLEIYLIHQQPLEELKELDLYFLIPIIMCLVFLLAYVFSLFNQFLLNKIINK